MTGIAQQRCTDAATEVSPLAVCTPREALRREPVSIEVRDGEEEILSPSRQGHEKFFAKVSLRTFDDLQVMGLVPRRMREQTVREAIEADDKEALRIAHQQMANGTAAAHECACKGGPARPASFSRDLKMVYRDIRRDYHPAMARALSEHFGTEFHWDSILAGSIRGWTRKVSVNEVNVVIGIFNDITIGRKSTLVLEPSATALYARALRIHRSGTLRHTGPHLKIWATAVESFLDLRDVVTQYAPYASWHLEH